MNYGILFSAVALIITLVGVILKIGANNNKLDTALKNQDEARTEIGKVKNQLTSIEVKVAMIEGKLSK